MMLIILIILLKQCNQEDYERRVDAIKDNFERVKKFYCVEDWLLMNMESYFYERHCTSVLL